MALYLAVSGKQHLSDLVKDYAARDQFNLDETGLVLRELPDKTMRTKGENCKVVKRSKERITV